MNTLLIVLQQQSNGLMNFLPLILIIVVFWFFMIRPQMKRQKELKNFRDSLKKGDKIVTTGGIYGKVLEIGDYYIIMEVEGQNRLKIDKSAVIKDMTDATRKSADVFRQKMRLVMMQVRSLRESVVLWGRLMIRFMQHCLPW